MKALKAFLLLSVLALSTTATAMPIPHTNEKLILQGSGFEFDILLVDTSDRFTRHHLPQEFEGLLTVPQMRMRDVPVLVRALLPDFERQFQIVPLREEDRTLFSTLIIGQDAFEQEIADFYFTDRFPERRHMDYQVFTGH